MQLNRDKFNYLSAVDVAESDWQGLTALGAVKHINAGAMLCEQGGAINELICITEGTVKLAHFFNNGNEKLYGQLRAPSLLGMEALWSAGIETFYPAAIALTDVTAYVVPIKQAEEYAAASAGMMVALFQCVRNVMCDSRIRSVCSAQMSMLQKAAFGIVLMNRAESDDEGYVTVTHEELAQFVGISRANVTTALAELVSRGLISKKRGKVRVSDKSGIMKLLENPFNCNYDNI